MTSSNWCGTAMERWSRVSIYCQCFSGDRSLLQSKASQRCTGIQGTCCFSKRKTF